MKLLLLLGLLILLSGCITINLNRGYRPADDKSNGTRQQNSGEDEEEDCDEQIQSARLAAYPRRMTQPSIAVTGQLLSGDQQHNCLEDETELPKKRFRTYQPTHQSRPHGRTSIATLVPVGNAHGWQAMRIQSLSAVISVTDVRGRPLLGYIAMLQKYLAA